MSDLVSFHERFRKPGAMTVHRIYRIAFAACIGMLLLGWAAPGHAADPDQGLPGADTAYGSGGASAPTGGKKPGPRRTVRDSTLGSKKCGPVKDRLTAISNRLGEIEKINAPLHKALRAATAQMKSLKCIDVERHIDRAKYQKCDRLRRERMAALRKIPANNKELGNLQNEKNQLDPIRNDCKWRADKQASKKRCKGLRGWVVHLRVFCP